MVKSKALTMLFGMVYFFFSVALFAQKLPFKIGKVSKEELLLTSCAIDSNASAMVLSEYCKVYFDYKDNVGFTINREVAHRIKILNKEGYEQANISIPLWKTATDKEKITKLKGFTYNLENDKIMKDKLSNDAIFEEEVNNNLDRIKVSMPKVKEGSVIELNYTIVSEFFFDFHSWYFQHEVPTLWSEYKVEIPEYFIYNKSYHGYIPLHINESGSEHKNVQINEKVRNSTGGSLRGAVKTTYNTYNIDYNVSKYRWVAKDVPAFIIEEPITSSENYISKIDFELASYKPPYSSVQNFSKSWDDIHELLMRSEKFGHQLSGNSFLNEIAEEINASASDDMAKMNLGFSYIQNHMKWNERYKVFATSTLRSAFKDQVGSSADINLMLVSLLQKLNLRASPVVLSTRANGRILPVHPTINSLNYVVACVETEEGYVLMDATDQMIAVGMLPVRALNDKGRIIRDKTSDWINLNTTTPSLKTVMYSLDLTDPANVKGNIQCSRKGYPAVSFRIKAGTENEQKMLIEQLEMENQGVKIDSWNFENLYESTKTVKEKYEFSYTEPIISGHVGYLDAIPLDAITENPFKLEERLYPVEYPYSFKYTYIFNYKIPENYSIEELPQAVSIQLPDGGGLYTFNVSVTTGMVQVMSKLEINKLIHLPQEYPILKEFYNQIIAKSAEQIVIKAN